MSRSLPSRSPHHNIAADTVKWCCPLDEDLKRQLLAIAELDTSIRSALNGYAFGNLNGVIYILNGSQTVCLGNETGNGLVGAVMGQGDWLGALTIGNRYQAYLMTEELAPTELLYFPGKKILNLAKTYPDIYRWLFHTAQSTQLKWLQANLAAHQSRFTRAAFALIEVTARQHDPIPTQPEIRVSQDQLARLSGFSRSRLNEVLRIFEQKGYVKLGRGKITLTSLAGLNEHLQELHTVFVTDSLTLRLSKEP
ncbi:Crp/Fnr family transcriptional regulator [Corallincola platygyrae]|uniref:Crp/Fnr family transcriptional regulator n=1 Tax=Corallincola platygyrae TaxID=1193278 RepID=A0ABW4XQX0_9GAMM